MAVQRILRIFFAVVVVVAAAAMEMDMVTFTVIVDDIVYTDGHTAMACIGGGGSLLGLLVKSVCIRFVC